VVDECHEADVLVRDVSNVMQNTATDNIANLLNRCLWVNVTEIDGSVAQVVHTISLLSSRPPRPAAVTTATQAAGEHLFEAEHAGGADPSLRMSDRRAASGP
jgi:hypothetical protein